MSVIKSIYPSLKYFSEQTAPSLPQLMELSRKVNERIKKFDFFGNRWTANIARLAMAFYIFCVSVGAYYFKDRPSSPSLKGRAVLNFLRMAFRMKAGAVYRSRIEQPQTAGQRLDQASETQEKLEKIRAFFPAGFKSYPIEMEEVATEDSDPQSWLDFLAFAVQAPQIPETVKRELVREVFPLIYPSHPLSLLPSNPLRLKEGGVTFRRTPSEGKKVQAIVAYMQDGDTIYQKAQDLQRFILSEYFYCE